MNYTTKSWIEKAKIVHGDKYDYSHVSYRGSKYKVSIICPIHGEFLQVANQHLFGHGCSKCGKTWNTEKFITKANKIHCYKYNYSKSVYLNMQAPIIITCRQHGDFETKALIHLQGCNCPKCNQIFIENFVVNANKKHNNKYDYSNSIYTKAHNKIEISCTIHGAFLQRASAHLSGQGCPACSKEVNRFKLSAWKNYYELAYFYIIECYNTEENFVKIGITGNFKQRFDSKSKMPYSFKVLHLIESSDTEGIWHLEKSILKKLKPYKYIPKIKFGGSMHECAFPCDNVDKIICADIEQSIFVTGLTAGNSKSEKI